MRQAAGIHAQVRAVSYLFSQVRGVGGYSRSKEVELVRGSMTVTDPIADMLTRIRNAVMVGHDSVLIPSSRLKLAIAKILKQEGFIEDYEHVKSQPHNMIKVTLKYVDKQPALLGLERVSKPGLRVYTNRREIPRVHGGLGIAILSTSQGVVTGQEAWKRALGGEVLCYVW